MRVALGGLRWSPDVFWKSTPRELFAGIRGLNMMNGDGDDQSSDPMLREEFEKLKVKVKKRKSNAVHS